MGAYRRMSVNGNQVLSCSAKTGLLLHRQLGVSRSSLTSSAGPLTSNTPLIADKLIGFGQAGQQMGMFTFMAAQQNLSVLLRLSIQNPDQLFSWDVKRKRVSGLWESNKMPNPLLVKAVACLKKREKELVWGKEWQRQMDRDTLVWCHNLNARALLDKMKSQHLWRIKTLVNIDQRAYQDKTTEWCSVISLIWKRE